MAAPHFVLQERGKHHLAMIEVIRVAWILVVNLLGLAIFFDWIGTKWREQWGINWWISEITGISSHPITWKASVENRESMNMTETRLTTINGFHWYLWTVFGNSSGIKLMFLQCHEPPIGDGSLVKLGMLSEWHPISVEDPASWAVEDGFHSPGGCQVEIDHCETSPINIQVILYYICLILIMMIL